MKYIVKKNILLLSLTIIILITSQKTTPMSRLFKYLCNPNTLLWERKKADNEFPLPQTENTHNEPSLKPSHKLNFFHTKAILWSENGKKVGVIGRFRNKDYAPDNYFSETVTLFIPDENYSINLATKNYRILSAAIYKKKKSLLFYICDLNNKNHKIVLVPDYQKDLNCQYINFDTLSTSTTSLLEAAVPETVTSVTFHKLENNSRAVTIFYQTGNDNNNNNNNLETKTFFYH